MFSISNGMDIKRKHIIFLVLAIVVLVVITTVVPFDGAEAGPGILKKPFGGKILKKPASIVTKKKQQCQSEQICQGTTLTWIPLTSVSCSKGTFSLKPKFPKKSTVKNYCASALAVDKTKRTPHIAVGRWILGLHLGEQPTIIGECICETPPAAPIIKTVTVGMAQVTMFGTSKLLGL